MSDAQLQGRRLKAAWIDIAVLVLLAIICLVLFGKSSTTHVNGTVNGSSFHDTDHSRDLSGPGLYLFFGLGLLYYFLTELLTGQTLGKRLMGVRVTDVAGADPTPVAILLRTLGRIVDILPILYLLGWLSMRGGHRPRQRLGDRIAGTTVSPAAE